jgi:quinol monooxygenase YgiN
MPYMRVTRGRIDPARIDEVNTLAQEIAAAIRRLPGNQSWLAGIDRASGRALTVSTWDTAENARADRLAGTDLASRVQALGVQMDPPEFFEVASPA